MAADCNIQHTLLPRHVRQPHHQSREVGDEQQHGQDRQVERHERLHHLLGFDAPDAGTNVQPGSDWRCDRADAQVHDREQAEVDRIDTDAANDRQEDRCEDQDGRTYVHEHADDQQHDIDQQQDNDFVRSQAQYRCADRLRDACEGHREGHHRGSRQQERDRTGRQHRFLQHREDVFDCDCLVEEHRDQQRVGNRDCRSFDRREDTGQDAADDDDDQHDARNRFLENLES